eukprot:gnl/Hemi2/12330_TR4217_c0_g1_i1.p1 gnl/Hemi2/12330_TR4217_c0_g1~~gnl/Hemi2/12330_TR4217_c0_g1_i1.p1  ORF type:complete len:368 (-),score=82.39 gnl/Hemi2/12330_TR4217_c0_g1_i1:135-1238(-)
MAMWRLTSAGLRSLAPLACVGAVGVLVIRSAFSTSAKAPSECAGFDAAAACLSKRSDSPTPKLYRSDDANATCAECGEDAFFMADLALARHPTTTTAAHKTFAMGIADGVGGWASKGYDPSRMAWGIMLNARDAVRRLGGSAESGEDGAVDPAPASPGPSKELIPSPLQLMRVAHRRILSETKKGDFLGSTTACVVSLVHRETPDFSGLVLLAANLGDSGFMVLRNGELKYRSTAQEHRHNCPYQLSMPLPSGLSRHLQDSPDSADSYVMKVQHGDLVVLATDGVFDNLTDEEIVYVANGGTKAPGLFGSKKLTPSAEEPVGQIAQRLVSRARSVAESGERWFQDPSNQRFSKKMDDITVVVGRIVP